MKNYNIYIAGGEKINTVKATCISKACKAFIATLDREAKYEIYNEEYTSISYTENYTICSDYVVMAQQNY